MTRKVRKATFDPMAKIRSGPRKQWNSLFPALKELVDNSRDAEATKVLFEFGNYNGNSYINDSGGFISFLDDGRGLPKSKSKKDYYDWFRVLSEYGDQQKETSVLTKAGQNGIGLKDVIQSFGNKTVLLTKAEGGPVEIVMRDYYNISPENFYNYEIISLQFLEDNKDFRKILPTIKQMEQDLLKVGHGFGVVIWDTRRDPDPRCKKPNNYWSKLKEPLTIKNLVKELVWGCPTKPTLPLSAYYPIGLEGYNQPSIFVNGVECPKIENLEAAYWESGDDRKLEIKEVPLNGEDFLQDYYKNEKVENFNLRTSYRPAGDQREFLLLKGGITLIRGGTVSGVCIQPRSNWKLQDQRSRRLNSILHYSQVPDFDEDWPIDKNKMQDSTSAFQQASSKDAYLQSMEPLWKKINDSYGSENEESERSNPEYLAKIVEVLSEYHTEQVSVHKSSSSEAVKNHNTNTLPQKSGNERGSYFTGFNVVENDESSPVHPHSFDKSTSGAACLITIYLKHPRIYKLYTKENQKLSYVVDAYAKGMMKDGNFEDYERIKEELWQRWEKTKDVK